VGTHKVEHAIRNKLWRILFTGPFAEISGKLVNPVVVLEIGGVKVVRIALAVVAIEVIKPLPKRIPRATLCSEPPFTKTTGRLPPVLECFGHRADALGQRKLPAKASWAGILDFLIITSEGVPTMHPGQQVAARRPIHGGTRVVLREAHPFTGELINVRRLDLLLTVAAQLLPAQVIGHDKHDVGGLFRRAGGTGRRHGDSQEKNDSRQGDFLIADHDFPCLPVLECDDSICGVSEPAALYVP